MKLSPEGFFKVKLLEMISYRISNRGKNLEEILRGKKAKKKYLNKQTKNLRLLQGAKGNSAFLDMRKQLV